jgi:thioredoxin reductase
MFFLHALATRRMQLRDQGDLKALEALPQVTVYEKASSPGGVWRNDRRSTNTTHDNSNHKSKSTTMYEGLWTNGHKQGMEFFDYTFKDHFQVPQPVYMPRKKILEYLLKRVTLHENIFQHVHFNTEVKYVKYDDELNKFAVSVQLPNGTATTQYFDKCVQAGGVNAKPKKIPSIERKLSNFKGQIVHSSEMSELTGAAKGKNILLIGGNLSAEDLALAFIKLGANKIYITSRNLFGDVVHSTTSWPSNKVRVLKETVPCGSYADDESSIRICEYDNEDGIIEDEYHDIDDIDIVVFCTGYLPAIDHLDESLLPCHYNDSCKTTSMDKNWRMETSWVMEKGALRHVEPSNDLELSDLYSTTALIRNPNMFYIFEDMTISPLLEIDVSAWLCMNLITGGVVFPSKEEMEEQSRIDLVRMMNYDDMRYLVDENFYYAIELLYKSVGESPSADVAIDDLVGETSAIDDLMVYDLMVYDSFSIRHMASKMGIAKYPLDLGSFNKLNHAGELLLQMDAQDDLNRWNLKYVSNEDKIWMTFRDMDPSQYKSVITDMGSASFEGRWLDIDDEGHLHKNETAGVPDVVTVTIPENDGALSWQTVVEK